MILCIIYTYTRLCTVSTYLSPSSYKTYKLTGVICPWVFFDDIGLNCYHELPPCFRLTFQLGYSTAVFQALRLVPLALFGAGREVVPRTYRKIAPIFILLILRTIKLPFPLIVLASDGQCHAIAFITHATA